MSFKAKIKKIFSKETLKSAWQSPKLSRIAILVFVVLGATGVLCYANNLIGIYGFLGFVGLALLGLMFVLFFDAVFRDRYN